MLAAIGEFERDLIKERAADGIARAKVNGVKFGARRKLSDDQISEIRMWRQSPQINRADLARKYGISRSTLYRLTEGLDGQNSELE